MVFTYQQEGRGSAVLGIIAQVHQTPSVFGHFHVGARSVSREAREFVVSMENVGFNQCQGCSLEI